MFMTIQIFLTYHAILLVMMMTQKLCAIEGTFTAFILLTKCFLLVPNVIAQNKSDSTSFISNFSKEEKPAAVRQPEDPGTLYSRETLCRAPKPLEPLEPYRHIDTSWSFLLFNRPILDAGDKPDTWQAKDKVYKDTKNEKHVESEYDILIIFLFPVALIIFLIVSAVIIPIVGFIVYHILEVVWYLATHSEFKRLGRRVIIIIEKIKRARQKLITSERVKKSKFYLPKFFRLHSEEDLPDELEESEDDDDVWITTLGEDSEEEDDDERQKLGAGLNGL